MMPDDTPIDPTTPAVDAPVSPRPLDQISAEVAAAKIRHSAAIAELQTAGGILKALALEYRAAVTWADQECTEVESAMESTMGNVESWISRHI